jgi:hypothetical protein
MDSPITADQREGCIAELKRDNQRDFFELQKGLFIAPWYFIGLTLMWFSITEQPASEQSMIAIFCIALVVVAICFAVSAWAVMHWIAEIMRRYAASILTQTGLVNFVLRLPSDVQAYRGRIRAVLTGEWLTFRRERFDARRRAKAIIMRFGTWCRRFGHSPEPWEIRGAIYTFSGTLILYCAALNWITGQPSVRQILDQHQPLFHPYSPIGVGIQLSLMAFAFLRFSVLRGRCIGTRMALIEYFEAEAARSAAGVAEIGASDV